MSLLMMRSHSERSEPIRPSSPAPVGFPARSSSTPAAIAATPHQQIVDLGAEPEQRGPQPVSFLSPASLTSARGRTRRLPAAQLHHETHRAAGAYHGDVVRRAHAFCRDFGGRGRSGHGSVGRGRFWRRFPGWPARAQHASGAPHHGHVTAGVGARSGSVSADHD